MEKSNGRVVAFNGLNTRITGINKIKVIRPRNDIIKSEKPAIISRIDELKNVYNLSETFIKFRFSLF